MAPLTFDDFKQQFSGCICSSSEKGYNERLARYWSHTTIDATGMPRHILCPKTSKDVALALRYFETNMDGISIISGRQWAGRNCGTGLLLDMNMYMNKAEIVDHPHHPSGKAIRVDGGATWEEVDRTAIQKELATVSASYAPGGVAASALAGGYGHLVGKHGLAVDNVLEVEMVLADGRIEVCHEKHNPDIFWAVRGAGPALGCITSITLRAYKQEAEVFYADLSFTASKAAEVAEAANNWHKNAGENEAVILAITCLEEPMITVQCFNNSNQDLEASLQKFNEFIKAGPIDVEERLVRWEEANKQLDKYAPHPFETQQGRAQGSDRRVAQAGGLCSALDSTNLRGIIEQFSEFVKAHTDFKHSVILIDMYPSKKYSSVRKSDMAFIGRTEYHNSNIMLQYTSPDFDALAKTHAHALGHAFYALDKKTDSLMEAPRYSGYTSYLNGAETFGENDARVMKVKSHVDPRNVFNKWVRVEQA